MFWLVFVCLSVSLPVEELKKVIAGFLRNEISEIRR